MQRYKVIFEKQTFLALKNTIDMKKFNLSEIMTLAHQFIKRYGVSLSEALQIAWRNAKLKNELHKRIVHFYFQKVDGSLREAWGTLAEDKQIGRAHV